MYYKNTNQSDYYAYYDEKDSLIYKLPTIDGKTLYTYACSNELKFSTKARSGIGTICHEFSHVLGLPDYYITDSKYSNLSKYTPGAWSLMGYGNYLNNGNTPPNFSIFDKYYLGWIEPNVLNHSTTYQLPADGKTGYMYADYLTITGAINGGQLEENTAATIVSGNGWCRINACSIKAVDRKLENENQ